MVQWHKITDQQYINGSDTNLHQGSWSAVQLPYSNSRDEEHGRQSNQPSNEFCPWWVLILVVGHARPLRNTEQEDCCHNCRSTEPPTKPPPSSRTMTDHFLNVKRKPVGAINPGQSHSFKEGQKQQRNTSRLVVKKIQHICTTLCGT